MFIRILLLTCFLICGFHATAMQNDAPDKKSQIVSPQRRQLPLIKEKEEKILPPPPPPSRSLNNPPMFSLLPETKLLTIFRDLDHHSLIVLRATNKINAQLVEKLFKERSEGKIPFSKLEKNVPYPHTVSACLRRLQWEFPDLCFQMYVPDANREEIKRKQENLKERVSACREFCHNYELPQKKLFMHYEYQLGNRTITNPYTTDEAGQDPTAGKRFTAEYVARELKSNALDLDKIELLLFEVYGCEVNYLNLKISRTMATAGSYANELLKLDRKTIALYYMKNFADRLEEYEIQKSSHPETVKEAAKFYRQWGSSPQDSPPSKDLTCILM